tara:strand:- start:4 stop:1515 length:1512 start_codon:yes stop_codon:yes gene_type:complete
MRACVRQISSRCSICGCLFSRPAFFVKVGENIKVIPEGASHVIKLPTLVSKAQKATPLHLVDEGSLPAWLKSLSTSDRTWVKSNGFEGRAGRRLVLPAEDGSASMVVCGMSTPAVFWNFSGLPTVLPHGDYRLERTVHTDLGTSVALGWALGGYGYSRYGKGKDKTYARLVWPVGADRGQVSRTYAAIALARDLINTPASDLGPAELAAAARSVAKAAGAKCRVITGNALLKQNYPMIHAVGRASDRPPRLIDLRWGAARHPKVTLVGKGVCFDTGGLDLKPASGMALMKKDMGGAAAALGLAQMIMDANLKVRLRLLIPAVENSVSGDSFRPGDVLTSRKGLTVEIGNTDAEGRLILADVLAEADSEKPDLLVDFATLTGAARIALGPDLPALYTHDDALADDLARHGQSVSDPLWRMPLWKPYDRMIRGRVADINNAGEDRMAGSITAALFLDRFVDPGTSWAHFDIFGWNRRNRPGRPEGGEAQAMRAVYALIEERYSSS